MRRTRKAFIALGKAIANDQMDIAMEAMRDCVERNSYVLTQESVANFKKLDTMWDTVVKIGWEFHMPSRPSDAE